MIRMIPLMGNGWLLPRINALGATRKNQSHNFQNMQYQLRRREPKNRKFFLLPKLLHVKILPCSPMQKLQREIVNVLSQRSRLKRSGIAKTPPLLSQIDLKRTSRTYTLIPQRRLDLHG